jgi:hypothetical protein
MTMLECIATEGDAAPGVITCIQEALLNKGGPMIRKNLPPNSAVAAELTESLVRGEKDLDISEIHAAELSMVEHNILREMKRKDREYKDSHFHSIPKPLKHTN